MKDYEQIISTLLARITDLKKLVAQQAAEIAELKRRLNNVDRLVYYEACGSIVVAIEREKQIKGWSRKKKHDLINALNPE